MALTSNAVLYLPLNDSVADKTGRHTPVAVNAPVDPLDQYVDSMDGFDKAISFNGSQYISVPDSDDWNLGTGKFTFDCFFYIPSNTDIPFYSQSGDSGNDRITLHWDHTNNRFEFLIRDAGTFTLDVYFPASVTTEVFHHLALVRNANVWNLYLNGTALSKTLNIGAYTAAIPDFSYAVEFGRIAHWSMYHYGYFDGIRLVKGEAVWTANFTPPAVPYEICYAALALRRNAGVTKTSAIAIKRNAYRNLPIAALALRRNAEVVKTASLALRRKAEVMKTSAIAISRDQYYQIKEVCLSLCRHVKTYGRNRLPLARDTKINKYVRLALDRNIKAYATCQLALERYTFAPDVWEIYIDNVFYASIDKNGSGELSGIALADGTHRIEARPSGNFWHGLFSPKALTVKISGGEIVQLLPAIINLEVSEYASIRYLSWSWEADFGVDTPVDFAVWKSATTPVVTSGDPDVTIEAVAAGMPHRIPFSQTADLYLAVCARDTESNKGEVSEILAEYPSVTVESPEFQWARP